MAYTIHQYETVAPWGEPVQPANATTESQAFGAAVQLAAGTIYVDIVPDADMYLRISNDGAAATAADYKLLAGETYGFPVQKRARPRVYGVAV